MDLILQATYLILLAVEPSGIWICESGGSPIFTQNPSGPDCRPYERSEGSFQKISEEEFYALSGRNVEEHENFVRENQPEPRRKVRQSKSKPKPRQARARLQHAPKQEITIKIVPPRARRKADRKL